MTVKVTTGDTQPLLSLALTDANTGNPLDLTNATEVVWHIKRGTTDVTKTATIDADPTTGVTTVQWDGDVSITPADWLVKPVIHWNDGTIETAVNGEIISVLAAA